MKWIKSIILSIPCFLLLTGCYAIDLYQKPMPIQKTEYGTTAAITSTVTEVTTTTTTTIFAPTYPEKVVQVPVSLKYPVDVRVQAEDCKLSEWFQVDTEYSGYTGSGYVVGLSGDLQNTICFTVNVPASQHYDVSAILVADSDAVCTLQIDDEMCGTLEISGTGHFIQATVKSVYLEAVDMKKDEIRALEEKYAKAECPVVSNNSAHRATPDVPMVVPEINPEHIEIIKAQRERLGTKRGFIAVKSNCSLQSYVPALNALKDKYGIKQAMVCTYQAISGAGKTFETMPEIIDNVIPYIGGEEEKSEQEPLKIWGHIEGNRIVNADGPKISSQCLRVPVSDGHTAAIFVQFDKKPTKEEVIKAWTEYSGVPQELELPSAPKQFLHYFTEDNRPQAKLDRNLENGMAISIGRLRDDIIWDYKFVCLSHNTLRGAAGGAVLMAELLAAKGYFD